MIRHFRTLPVWFGLAVALSSCSSAPASDSPTVAPLDSASAAVRVVVSQTWHDHIEAAKRKDAVGVAAMYAADAVYVVPGLQEVHGRPAIDEMEAHGLTEADVLEVAHTSHDLRVFGEVAYEIGTVAGPVRFRGQAAETVTFHFMAMWQRQADGVWRVKYFVGQPQSALPPSKTLQTDRPSAGG
jgi:uncharacterized protein (TIGR02246 family)